MITLLVGVGTILVSMGIQILACSLLLRFLLPLKQGALPRTGFWQDMTILSKTLLILLGGNLTQMALWAYLFRICGEFPDYSTAFYHSVVNFSTLGYGDLVMTPRWRLLGALEAVNGVLMFGLSTAILFTVLNWRIIQAAEQQQRKDPTG
jgi:hypothetical protein